MDDGTTLRAGIIGFGLSGAAFHAPALARAGFDVCAVVTRDPARAAQATERHPGVTVVPRADDLPWRALDAVVVATPNRDHVPLARAAIAHGVPVVVDKPVAATAAGVRELIAAGGLVVPFHNRRWDGDFMTLRDDVLARRRLGRVHTFESRFERFRPQVADGWREDDDPAAGGGVLLDLGPHLVDQALLLFGPARRVEADVRTVRAGARTPDHARVTLHHAGGVVSHLHMSAVSAHLGPRLRVLGDAGAFVKEGLDPQESVLRSATPDGPVPPEPPARLHLADGATEDVPLRPGDYPAFYRGMAATLRPGAPPPVPLQAALDVALVLDEAARHHGLPHPIGGS